MVPKKAKDLIPLVAKELGLHEELVDVIVTVYWQEIRKAMSELRGNRVNVVNFGLFMTSRPKMLKLEKKYAAFVSKKEEANTFRKYAMVKEAETRLNSIRKLLEDLQKDQLKKQTVTDKKHAYKTKSNLEEPKGDTPGYKE